MSVKRVYEFYSEQRFLFLLISLLLLLLISPILKEFIRIKILLDIFFTMVLISGIDATRRDKKHLVFVIILSLPLLLSIWIDYLIQINFILVIGNVFGVAFFIYTIVVILKYVFKQGRVSREVIYAAIVVYLLMGILWSLVFHMVEHIQPSSFSGIENAIGDKRFGFIYFSFVTLTTLGYGDISPVNPVASSMAILEAIIGQLYLVVQIAWLVGLRVSQRTGGNQ